MNGAFDGTEIDARVKASRGSVDTWDEVAFSAELHARSLLPSGPSPDAASSDDAPFLRLHRGVGKRQARRGAGATAEIHPIHLPDRMPFPCVEYGRNWFAAGHLRLFPAPPKPLAVTAEPSQTAPNSTIKQTGNASVREAARTRFLSPTDVCFIWMSSGARPFCSSCYIIPVFPLPGRAGIALSAGSQPPAGPALISFSCSADS